MTFTVEDNIGQTRITMVQKLAQEQQVEKRAAETKYMYNIDITLSYTLMAKKAYATYKIDQVTKD